MKEFSMKKIGFFGLVLLLIVLFSGCLGAGNPDTGDGAGHAEAQVSILIPKNTHNHIAGSTIVSVQPYVAGKYSNPLKNNYSGSVILTALQLENGIVSQEDTTGNQIGNQTYPTLALPENTYVSPSNFQTDPQVQVLDSGKYWEKDHFYKVTFTGTSPVSNIDAGGLQFALYNPDGYSAVGEYIYPDALTAGAPVTFSFELTAKDTANKTDGGRIRVNTDATKNPKTSNVAELSLSNVTFTVIDYGVQGAGLGGLLWDSKKNAGDDDKLLLYSEDHKFSGEGKVGIPSEPGQYADQQWYDIYKRNHVSYQTKAPEESESEYRDAVKAEVGSDIIVYNEILPPRLLYAGSSNNAELTGNVILRYKVLIQNISFSGIFGTKATILYRQDDESPLEQFDTEVIDLRKSAFKWIDE
jgi:hypothetical protein